MLLLNTLKAALFALNTIPAHPDTPAILVVDDNEMNLRLMVHLLEKTGCPARLARSGVEALELMEEQEFPLILMDCHMPGLDGYETTACIRQLEAQRGCGQRARIVAVTADIVPGTRERCIAAGMDDFLGKPVSPERVREVVQEALPAQRRTA